MDTEREWAERYLFKLAVGPGLGPSDPLPRSWSRERIDARCSARFEAAAEVLTGVGTLRESEVASFRRRLEDELKRGQHEVPALVGDDLARRARDLLGRRLTEVASEGRDAPPSAGCDSSHHAVARFEWVHAACVDCGALPEAELSRWGEKLREADGGRTWWLERERRQQRCSLSELLAVLPGSVRRAGGVRVVTVEIYHDGVLLRWHSRTGFVHARTGHGSTAAEPAYPPAPVSLTDDLGTDYLHVHTQQGGRSAGYPVVGKSTFATAVPPAARELVAEIGKECVTIARPELGGQQ